uniref:Uncharacterized protein n=1 Tax=Morchella brunnea TaxID=1174671 RepID=A0A8K1I7L4_9PEZI|nr:hypothetical protein LK370_mgp237 [Morchella brunnea]UBU98351.1 hypothetical protein [Morchella brunnea]
MGGGLQHASFAAGCMLKPPRAHNFYGTLPLPNRISNLRPSVSMTMTPRPPRWAGGSACRDRYRLGFFATSFFCFCGGGGDRNWVIYFCFLFFEGKPKARLLAPQTYVFFFFYLPYFNGRFFDLKINQIYFYF